MEAETIAWHVFFEAMNRQPSGARERWLSAWRFADEGVFLRTEIAEQLQSHAREIGPANDRSQPDTLH